MLLRNSKAPKKRMVAARIESYHKGYLVGLQLGARKVVKKVKQVRKASVTQASKKMAIAKKVEAYQKGYQTGTQRGAVQERAELKKARQEAAKTEKVKRWKRSYARSQAHKEELAAKEAARSKGSKAWKKRLAAAKIDAYKDGMRRARGVRAANFPNSVAQLWDMVSRLSQIRRMRLFEPPDSAFMASWHCQGRRLPVLPGTAFTASWHRARRPAPAPRLFFLRSFGMLHRPCTVVPMMISCHLPLLGPKSHRPGWCRPPPQQRSAALQRPRGHFSRFRRP